MPTRQKAPVGAPCWIDLTTSDVEASRRFYSEVFGWVAEEPRPEFGGYFQFTKNGIPVAGCMSAMADMPVKDQWMTHLCTDDVQRTLKDAADQGGVVAFGPDPVGDLGYMSMVIDPSGAAIGAWQPVTFEGFGLLFAPGAPCWHELHTSDYDAVIPFYRDVFKWTTNTVSDIAEFRYTTLADGERFLAGIADSRDELARSGSSYWTLYLGAEPDEACAQIEKLGGRVIDGPADTDFGRIATVTDLQGNVIRVMKGNVGDLPESI